MTFTQADHDKAVELYERYGKTEWWPANTHWNAPERAWQCNIDGKPWWDGNFTSTAHALSAIAWAMVERFGTVEIERHDRHGWRVVLYSGWQPTRFLALAAAVEGMDAGR